MNNLKPCFSAYIFFGIVGLLGGTIFTIPVMIVDAFISSSIGDIYYVTVWIIGVIATVIYLSNYRIEIKEDKIVIPNSLFDHRKTTVNIYDLDNVKLDIGVSNKSKKSFYTLWLKMYRSRSQINIKVFSIKDLEIL